MDSNTTREQIDYLKKIMSSAEPYPIDELEKYAYYDDNDKERVNRCNATRAKKLLIELGIEV